MAPVDFGKEGISGEMRLAVAALRDHLGADGLRALQTHGSDTARGLAIYGLAVDLDTADIPAVLDTVRPVSADGHFGVRGWAWLAVRASVARP